MTMMENTGSTGETAGTALRSEKRVFPSHLFQSLPTDENAHFVQFYEHDDGFLELLCSFIETGLEAGGACLLFATEAHLASLEEQLRIRKRDLVSACAGDVSLLGCRRHAGPGDGGRDARVRAL